MEDIFKVCFFNYIPFCLSCFIASKIEKKESETQIIYVLQMAEIAEWCLSEEAVERPEMREIVVMLSQIMVSSIEWEASLGGNSQVFSGVFNGR